MFGPTDDSPLNHSEMKEIQFFLYLSIIKITHPFTPVSDPTEPSPFCSLATGPGRPGSEGDDLPPRHVCSRSPLGTCPLARNETAKSENKEWLSCAFLKMNGLHGNLSRFVNYYEIYYILHLKLGLSQHFSKTFGQIILKI